MTFSRAPLYHKLSRARAPPGRPSSWTATASVGSSSAVAAAVEVVRLPHRLILPLLEAATGWKRLIAGGGAHHRRRRCCPLPPAPPNHRRCPRPLPRWPAPSSPSLAAHGGSHQDGGHSLSLPRRLPVRRRNVMPRLPQAAAGDARTERPASAIGSAGTSGYARWCACASPAAPSSVEGCYPWRRAPFLCFSTSWYEDEAEVDGDADTRLE